MHRTLIFDSLWENEWEFDLDENPVAPGAKMLAVEIAEKLKWRGLAVSEISQRDYYGWAFSTQFERCSFYHVLKPFTEIHLTIALKGHLVKALLLQRPRAAFERYCSFLLDTLEAVRDISGFRWKRRGFQPRVVSAHESPLKKGLAHWPSRHPPQLGGSSPQENKMSDQPPLILSVADLAYSGGEVFDLLGSFLTKSELEADVQTAPLSDVVGSVRRLQPDVLIVGHRPLLDDEVMRERWEAAGSPTGGDIIKALKSDPTTKDTPVLLLEGLHDIEHTAQVYGADAFWKTFTDLGSLVDVIKGLIEQEVEGGG